MPRRCAYDGDRDFAARHLDPSSTPVLSARRGCKNAVDALVKLEYLDRASPNQKPTLLFYGGDAAVVRAVAEKLSRLSEEGIELSTLPGVEAVDQCRVVVQASKRETGIRRTGQNAFTWRLNADSLDHVLGFLEPFMEASTENGFQWLEESGEIDFIVSRGRYC